MAIQFGRQIIVDIAGTRIEQPRINFEVSFKRDSQEETGEVKIYNLSRSTYDHIEERGTNITIDAGYKGVGVPVRIFEGVAQRIWKTREDHAFVTMIALGDVLRSPETRGGAIEQSFEGEVSVREVAKAIVEKMGDGIEIGSLERIPVDAVVTNFQASGIPGEELDVLLQTIDGTPIRWYTDGNVIRFAEGSKAQPDVQVQITKTPTTGIIGVPETQEDGKIKVEMLLDGRMKVGGQIVVKESEYIDDAPYTITGVAHQGDNWKGRFVTLVEGVPPDQEETST